MSVSPPRTCFRDADRHWFWIVPFTISLSGFVTPALAQPPVVFIDHDLAGGFRHFPYDITTGPDGALWFTDTDTNYGYIGRIAETGAIREFPLFNALARPGFITAGPDGALWYSGNEFNYPVIGRVTVSGKLTEYVQSAEGITNGPDGALWFAADRNGIGRMTTAGQTTFYGILSYLTASGITTGPDGALWFTAKNTQFNNFAAIGRITTSGSVTQFSLPNDSADPRVIRTGPDGALWFTEFGGNAIGRITAGGAITEYPLPHPDSNPAGLTVGPDGALWFTEYDNGSIGRITTGGAITEYPLPDLVPGASAITLGPDSDLWCAGYQGGKIHQIVFPTAALTADQSTVAPGDAFTLTGSGFAAGETVNLHLNRTRAHLFGSTVADASGAFAASTAVPEASNGYNAVIARGATSGKLGATSLRVNTRLLVTPPVVSPGNAVEASGFGFLASEMVSVYWYQPRLLLGQVRADGNGSFSRNDSFSLTVPVQALPGVNAVYAKGSLSEATATGYIDVQ